MADMDRNKLHFYAGRMDMYQGEFKLPDSLKTMAEYARILSKPFPFVRVDFYFANNKIYFGEITFTPANGCLLYTSPSPRDRTRSRMPSSA